MRNVPAIDSTGLRAIDNDLGREHPDAVLISAARKWNLDNLLRADVYIADRGASAKMLLEHLALILPTIK